MAGKDELSVATLSLGDEGVQVDEKLNAVRQSVITGDVEQFLTTAGDTGDKSPLVYLMDWLHTWQQEYEAFVHVLGVQEEAEDGQEPTETEKDLAEMESEAEQLMKGFGKVATALLQRLSIQNPDSVVDRHGWTLLMQAANSGLCELTEELVARKADVNYGGTAKDASNPLYLAVESEHTAVALLLLKNGAIESATKLVTTPSVGAEAGDEDDDAEDDDCALFQACRFGHLSVIKEMLALGVDVNFALPSTGDRALHVSVMFEMQEVVELLAGSDKIDLNALNESAQTCLFGCSGVEIVKLLVAKGVDPNIKDIDGETALSMAQALGDDEVAEYLETATQ
ncbi:M-phase phosphoprotein 8 [Phytophthora pseudosyringae]|uniref:M-phase phosphoprotein 8 n=1 Tax=Phytophthora pseudosyringae TaxID=221518 RepID=A0A8T1WN86_9STRA|nr:M-phase phosphoprotein 8 [Phytophthora pseudosyringae]